MQIYGVLYGCRVVLPDGRDVTFQNLDDEGGSEYRLFLHGTEDVREACLLSTAIARFWKDR